MIDALPTVLSAVAAVVVAYWLLTLLIWVCCLGFWSTAWRWLTTFPETYTPPPEPPAVDPLEQEIERILAAHPEACAETRFLMREALKAQKR